MPYCNTSDAEFTAKNMAQIFYRTYGNGPVKILLIIGLAGTHDSWGPQIRVLAGTDIPNDEKSAVDDAGLGNGRVEVCAFDNRGVGRSYAPTKKSEYATTIMAKDAIALMDHLGWEKAHVFGHSMGGMIACKLSALVPDRVLSLALLNVTGGGFQCLPKLDRMTLSVAVRFLKAKTPEARAAVDLDTHYSQDYLDECVGQSTRRATLYKEYVKGISNAGMQPNHGFEGQINACWTHKMTRTEIEKILSAGFLISVIHGRHDIIAQMSHAKRLAKKLYPFAKMVDLHGGHLVSHERTNEVNGALLDLIKASECKTSPLDWTNLATSSGMHSPPLQAPDIGFAPFSFITRCFKHSTLCSLPITYSYGGNCFFHIFAYFSDWSGPWTVLSNTKPAPRSSLSSMYRVIERLNVFLIYLFGIFVIFYEFARRVVGRFKPVKIGAALT